MPRTFFTVAVVFAGLVVLTACGSAPPPTPTAAPTSAPQATPTTAPVAPAAAPTARGTPVPLPPQPTLPPVATKATTPYPTPTFAPIINVPLPTGQTTAATAAPTTAVSGAPTTAPATGGGPVASGTPTGVRTELKVEFVRPLSTAEEVDDISIMLRRVPGIFAVSGNEVGITIVYDAGLILPNQIRARLASLGHEVKP